MPTPTSLQELIAQWALMDTAECPASKRELDWFIDWVLMGEAVRPPGKRGGSPLIGLWFVRYGAKYMRRSDMRERRYVCILALRRWGGMTGKEAVSTVAQKVLGPSVSAKQIDSFRTALDEYHHPVKGHDVLGEYWYAFSGGSSGG